MSDVLVTGGTGKTGRRVAAQLLRAGQTVRVATRRPHAAGQVAFTWEDPTTHDDAFRGVGAVYLVAPTDRTDHADVMIPAIDRAVALGVQRFVLLSASSLEAGGPMMGAIHAYLRDTAAQWCVLRPSWFMQNFSEQQHLATIRDEGAIYTATGTGRVPFIDADDIAASAVAALIAPEAPNTDFILTGPEALSYSDIADRLSAVVGSAIRHVNMEVGALVQRLEALGMERAYAEGLAAMDIQIAGGAEDRTTGGVEALTGVQPRTFEVFAAAVAGVWA